MASLTIRDMPEDIELALKRRASQTGRSPADEALTILTRETRVEKRFGLGSLLADIGREAGNDGGGFPEVRDKTPLRALRMILIDTNVISEAWRPTPAAAVVLWLDHQPIESLFLSAITVAELRYGISIMPHGKRREVLDRRLEEDVLPLFAGRITPFDLLASTAYARLMASAKESGRAISLADGLIAATALSRGFSIATRDRSPYQAAGLQVIDPWEFTP